MRYMQVLEAVLEPHSSAAKSDKPLYKLSLEDTEGAVLAVQVLRRLRRDLPRVVRAHVAV